MTELNKFYPSANEWMWNYCIFLGKFTDKKGRNYDLGIYMTFTFDKELDYKNCSGAIVHGNEAGDYASGDMSYSTDRWNNNPSFFQKYIETFKRAKAKGLVNDDCVPIIKKEDYSQIILKQNLLN